MFNLPINVQLLHSNLLSHSGSAMHFSAYLSMTPQTTYPACSKGVSVLRMYWLNIVQRHNLMTKVSVCSLQPPAQGRTSPTKMLQNGSPSKCPRFMKVKNWENGTIYNDTLYHSASKVSHMQISPIIGWIKQWAAAFCRWGNHAGKDEKKLDMPVLKLTEQCELLLFLAALTLNWKITCVK